MAGVGYVDCHCHISAEEFREDFDDVIERAKAAKVKALISVTEQAGEFEKMIHLHQRYPSYVAPCFGIHPIQRVSATNQRSVTMQDLEPALPLFQKYRCELVAVGEIGLDFTPWLVHHEEDQDEQLKVFVKQLEISRHLELPVNVHSRSAASKTIRVLKEHGIQHALLHNFAGRPSVALEGVQAGYYFSFPPAVARNDQRFKLLKQIPLEHICLETDAPALGLDREERNEPKNIMVSCDFIARIKGVPADRVLEATTYNAMKLFPKIKNYPLDI
uniref:TatD DNase domain containing 3 n=3 Tax=Erpetoichthys calabaricus TaxID=27687 RepID=A0A8C4SRI4_ERPCA